MKENMTCEKCGQDTNGYPCERCGWSPGDDFTIEKVLGFPDPWYRIKDETISSFNLMARFYL
jgi:hypothetical protein